MKRMLGMVAPTLAALVLPALVQGEEITKMTDVKKVTANLYVEDVRECVKFWEKLGFTKAMEVPDGDKLAFAMMKKGDLEVMYGSYASLAKEPFGQRLAAKRGPTFLYVEVADLEAALASTKGAEIVAPVHSTFYGAKEFTIHDPGGHVITFAQFAPAH